MMMSVRMDCTTVTKMQTVQTRLEVLSVLAGMDLLEMGQLASVITICLNKGILFAYDISGSF